MKKIMSLFAFCLLVLVSCSKDGPIGPPGPQGPPGDSGDGALGQTFEFKDVDLDYYSDVNLYSTIIKIPSEVEVLDSDAILVYRRELVEDTETWSMLPQNFFLDDGTIQYVFNNTDVDVEILIDGNFNLSNLDSFYTKDQFFRFIVVPSNFAFDKSVDISDYESVKAALQQ